MKPLGIRSIVAATDLSTALSPMLRSAAELARLTEARLYIVHTTEHKIDEDRLIAHLRDAGIKPNRNVEAQILVGPPGAVIVQEAARVNADVIVLGPHRELKAASTAYRVVRAAEVPCLMLPAELHLPLERVMVALDVSEAAQGTLAVALTWTSALRQRQAGNGTTRLLAVHIANPQADQQARMSLEADVERVERRLSNIAGLKTEHAVEHASTPAAGILKRAEQDNSDLLVIGTRGRKLSADFLGSVSLEVVTKARHPVLLVPPGVWRATGDLL